MKELPDQPFVPPLPQEEINYPDKKQVIFDSKQHLKNVLDQQRLRKEADPSQQKCEVDITTDLPFVLVVGSSDWHLGNENTDHKLFFKHYELISETPGVYVNIIGDERDNFVTPKFRSGLFEGVMNPQQQADMVENLLRGWDEQGKILTRVGGNHDNWTWEGVGVNLENYWFSDMKSPLMKLGGFQHLTINGIKYLGWLHHGISLFNSQFNPNHASRRAFEFQGPFDFSMMGHTHGSEVAMGWKWSEEFAKPIVMCRTGTYKTEDAYAKSRQLPRGQAPGACILFSTTEKSMMGFDTIEKGIQALKALNIYHQMKAQGLLGETLDK